MKRKNPVNVLAKNNGDNTAVRNSLQNLVKADFMGSHLGTSDIKPGQRDIQRRQEDDNMAGFFEQIKGMYNEYWSGAGAPVFNKRMKNLGYSDKETRDIVTKNKGMLDKIEVSRGRRGSFSTQDDEQGKRQITYGGDYSKYPQSQLGHEVGHEVGHGVGGLFGDTDPTQYKEGRTGAKGWDMLDTLNQAYDKRYTTDKYGRRIEAPTPEITKYGLKPPPYDTHLTSPRETKHDIDALRFLMHQDGTGKPWEEVTIESLDETIKNYPGDIQIERLLWRYDKEVLIELMNTLASNETNNILGKNNALAKNYNRA